MARPTKAEAAYIAKRRAKALKWRLDGHTPLDIGKKLAADPELNSAGEAFPMGYGSKRYAEGKPPPSDRHLIIRVCQDLAHALKAARGEQILAADDYRDIEAARLERLFKKAQSMVDDPDAGIALAAIDRALKVSDRRAKLLGLDAPVELSGPGGGGLIVEVLPGLIPPPMDENADTA